MMRSQVHLYMMQNVLQSLHVGLVLDDNIREFFSQPMKLNIKVITNFNEAFKNTFVHEFIPRTTCIMEVIATSLNGKTVENKNSC